MIHQASHSAPPICSEPSQQHSRLLTPTPLPVLLAPTSPNDATTAPLGASNASYVNPSIDFVDIHYHSPVTLGTSLMPTTGHSHHCTNSSANYTIIPHYTTNLISAIPTTSLISETAQAPMATPKTLTPPSSIVTLQFDPLVQVALGNILPLTSCNESISTIPLSFRLSAKMESPSTFSMTILEQLADFSSYNPVEQPSASVNSDECQNSIGSNQSQE